LKKGVIFNSGATAPPPLANGHRAGNWKSRRLVLQPHQKLQRMMNIQERKRERTGK